MKTDWVNDIKSIIVKWSKEAKRLDKEANNAEKSSLENIFYNSIASKLREIILELKEFERKHNK